MAIRTERILIILLVLLILVNSGCEPVQETGLIEEPIINETEMQLPTPEKIPENDSQIENTVNESGIVNETIEKGLLKCDFKDNYSNDMCYLELSDKYPNNYYCNYFTNEARRNNCRTKWALKKNDTYYCLVQPLAFAIGCYHEFIGIIKDTSICYTISDLKLKKCLSEANEFFSPEKKKEICEESKMAPWDYCIQRLAITTKDKTWCVKAEEDSYCYSGYVLATLDESGCERIKDEYSEDICYKHVAVKKQDKEICEKIRSKQESGDNTRVRCRLEVAEALSEESET
jgi:hypothetical protein